MNIRRTMTSLKCNLLVFMISASLVAASVVIHLGQDFMPAWAQEKRHLKVALLTNDLFTDRGWGGSAYNASQVLKSKYGLDLITKDNISISNLEPELRDAAANGSDIIIAQGIDWGNPIARISNDYPNSTFIIFNGLTNSTNVSSIFPMQQEGSFLLGALAGMMTKTNSLGCVGGKAHPNIVNLFEGFKQGAKLTNPNVKITCIYIDDFQSPFKGKEAGLSLIDKGADFLFQAADLSGNGVIEAAKEKGIFAFGNIVDQNQLAPNTVLSSIVLDTLKAFEFAIKMVQNGTSAGQIYKPGIENTSGGQGDGIMYIAPFNGLASKVAPEIKSKLAQLTQDVLSKKIMVPERHDATP